MKACSHCRFSALCLPYGFERLCRCLFAQEVLEGQCLLLGTPLTPKYEKFIIPAFHTMIARRSVNCPMSTPEVVINGNGLRFVFKKGEP